MTLASEDDSRAREDAIFFELLKQLLAPPVDKLRDRAYHPIDSTTDQITSEKVRKALIQVTNARAFVVSKYTNYKKANARERRSI